jgi:hypothetical protein
MVQTVHINDALENHNRSACDVEETQFSRARLNSFYEATVGPPCNIST